MDITVKNLYIRISPRKVRPVLYGFRGENIDAAITKAVFTHKKAAGFLAGLLKSGRAAAKEVDLDLSKVYIKSICCNEGPRLKRRRFESRGRTRRILKRMSHLVLTVSDSANNELVKSEIKNLKPETSEEKE